MKYHVMKLKDFRRPQIYILIKGNIANLDTGKGRSFLPKEGRSVQVCIYIIVLIIVCIAKSELHLCFLAVRLNYFWWILWYRLCLWQSVIIWKWPFRSVKDNRIVFVKQQCSEVNQWQYLNFSDFMQMKKTVTKLRKYYIVQKATLSINSDSYETVYSFS